MVGAPAESEQIFLGGVQVNIFQVLLRKAFAESELVAVATVGRSVVVEEVEGYVGIRTELVLSSVLKGKTWERAVSVYHHQTQKEEASRWRPGDTVLAFLEPREAGHGKPAEGYVAAAPPLGAASGMIGEEFDAYRRQTEALARLAEQGAHPSEVMAWLVATTEDPLTRWEAVQDLQAAVSALEELAARRGKPLDQTARDLRSVIDGYLAGGGSFDGEAAPAILGIFLTDAQKERLTEALLATERLSDSDIHLFQLVRRWERKAALSWLRRRVEERILAKDHLNRWAMDLLAEADGEDRESLEADE